MHPSSTGELLLMEDSWLSCCTPSRQLGWSASACCVYRVILTLPRALSFAQEIHRPASSEDEVFHGSKRTALAAELVLTAPASRAQKVGLSRALPRRYAATSASQAAGSSRRTGWLDGLLMASHLQGPWLTRPTAELQKLGVYACSHDPCSSG